jgi:hypothetical protein
MIFPQPWQARFGREDVATGGVWNEQVCCKNSAGAAEFPHNSVAMLAKPDFRFHKTVNETGKKPK